MSTPKLHNLATPRRWGIATYPPGATFGPRHLTDWEFVWLIEGDAEYTWNDHVVSAPENSVVLCRPGAVDFFRWDAQRRTRHGYFHFDISHWPGEWPDLQSFPFVRLPAPDDILPALFRYILAWSAVGDAAPSADDAVQIPDAMQRSVAIAHFLLAFCSGESGTRSTPSDRLPEAIQSALKFIYGRLEADPQSALTLSQIAGAACVTPEHLCRVMKTATGLSPLETVRLARLDRAMTLLARSNYAIGEIATLCGFASAFHFSRRFKEVYGQSPRDVRVAVRNGATPPLPPHTWLCRERYY